MSELIISVSGLRGIVGQSLTPAVVVNYLTAFATWLKTRPTVAGGRPVVVIGRDGRSSGVSLQHAAIAALQASGCDCRVADVAATPTIGVLVRALQADGGIQLSASHNPPPYNGIKLFDASGRVINAQAGAAVKTAYLNGDQAWCDFDQIGHATLVDDPHAPHLQSVLKTVDTNVIRSRRFRVLLDSNHGAGGALGRRLLEQLGCEVTVLGETPDGQFEHVPEPTAENLQEVAAIVRNHGCDVGFCQDPDADRLAIVDADGRYVGEECTLALCVQRALQHEATRGPIVINGASSSMSEMLAANAAVPCYRSAVGEANVADKMIAVNASYGGEGNGGPIDPRVGLVRDSFVGMAQVLALMAETGKTLAQLVDALPKRALHKSKASIAGVNLQEAIQTIVARFADAEADHSDGLRLTWPDRWLLVRGSNTEPIVRLIAEAEDESTAAAMCEQAALTLHAAN